MKLSVPHTYFLPIELLTSLSGSLTYFQIPYKKDELIPWGIQMISIFLPLHSLKIILLI